MNDTAPQPHSEVLIVAHRGSSGEAPENTRAAFARAAESGAEAVECDIRLSLDGELVVFHDRTVNRTTNGRGPVGNLTLAKLRVLDAGAWFHRRFTGERILTFDEALDLLRCFQWINVEMKCDFPAGRNTAILVERAVDSIRSAHLNDSVILSSFHHTLLRRSREIAPGIKTMAIYNGLLHGNRMPTTVVRKSGAVGFVGGKHEVFAPMLRNAQRGGIPVFIYTLNTAADLRRWMKRGVTGVITNFPARAVDVRSKLTGV